MGIVTRPAESEDIEWVLPQLKEFSEFYGTHHRLFPTNDHAFSVVSNLIDNHFFRVAETPHEKIGFLAGTFSPHFCNPDLKVLSELWWWVDPEHRQSFAGSMLFRDFMEFGEEKADWIVATLEHHSPVPEEFILSKGFKLQEKTYLREVH